MALGPAIILDLALNPRVQDVAGRLFNSVYSRIFKDGSNKPTAELIDIRSLSPTEQILAERLQSIEKQLSCLPTDEEMALAFASLQAEVRIGQKRLLLAVIVFGLVNGILLLALLTMRI